MFQNLPLCVIKNPAGTYSYVGSIPRELGAAVPASKSDVAGGRAFKSPDGALLVTKFPTFETEQQAIDYAAVRGYEVRV